MIYRYNKLNSKEIMFNIILIFKWYYRYNFWYCKYLIWIIDDL